MGFEGRVAQSAASLALLLTMAGLASGQTAAVSADPVRDLVTAARHGDLPAVERALAAGARVDAPDPHFQQTALMRAAMFDKPLIVEALLRAGASVARRSDLQRTPLQWAVIGRSPDAVRLLLRAGADVEATDADSETALGWALDGGQVATVRLLLDAGADATRVGRSIAYQLSLVMGNALEGEPREALRLAIRRGRGLERDDRNGRTALLVAASWAHLDGSAAIVAELLAAGARTDARGPEGRSAVEDVRERIARAATPAHRANLERALAVLATGSRR